MNVLDIAAHADDAELGIPGTTAMHTTRGDKRVKKTIITGGSGMVGHACRQAFPTAQLWNSSKCDLRNQQQVNELFEAEKPEYIIHLAAKVGGIKANQTNLATFYYDNIMINTNVLHAAHRVGTKKVVSLLSTCIYPDAAIYPLTTDQIHNGMPHLSNYAYAFAKRMVDIQSKAYREQHGCNFVTAVPNNLYGENDNFDLENSHVIPAMIRKIYEAKQSDENVVLWGDGTPLREFTYASDLARILKFVLEDYDDPRPLNVGNTQEVEIRYVANLIGKILDFKGDILWDTTKPKGQFRKPSDNSRLIELGWSSADYTPIEEGLQSMCHWFVENYPNVRGV